MSVPQFPHFFQYLDKVKNVIVEFYSKIKIFK